MLDSKRRLVASDPETRHQAKEIWNRIKDIEKLLLSELVESVVQKMHVLGLEYYNSRGGVMPWNIAVGGRELYSRIIKNAEIYSEQVT